MRRIEELFTLVKSMTKSEKRYFQLYSNRESGEKKYHQLYNLLNLHTSIESTKQAYCNAFGKSSLNSSTQHLYRVLMETLSHLHIRSDKKSQLLHYIINAKVLAERGLNESAHHALERAMEIAENQEDYLLIVHITSLQAQYHSAEDFEKLKEKELIERQVKANETLRHARIAIQHNQLYDVLKYRSLHRRAARTEEDKRQMNDLVLSELHLMSNTSYTGLKTEKLHMLFQSTYFLYSGNYGTAIRFYEQLVSLFEEAEQTVSSPTHYLNIVLGSLDSIESAGLYTYVPSFTERLKKLEKGDYSTEFKRKVQAYIYIYEVSSLICCGKLDEAVELHREYEEILFKKIGLLDLELQLKLNLNGALLHLVKDEKERARTYLQQIFELGGILHRYRQFKVARMVNLLLQTEAGNFTFVEAEIKSIKREITAEKDSRYFQTEKVLFRFLQLHPLPNIKEEREEIWREFEPTVKQILRDKHERPIQKIFDFMAWIESSIKQTSLLDTIVSNSRYISATQDSNIYKESL